MKAIDLFAGWGGMTEGAEQAGIPVVYAANHNQLAVEAHSLNHPGAEHVCQDLRQADWGKLPAYDLLLAAPACQGHSTASQPRRRLYHDNLRATAWAVVDCADVTEPSAIVVENVPAFKRWRLFRHWVEALETLGYHVTEHELTATAHGVPQRRTRLFFVAMRRPGFSFRSPVVTTEPAFADCIEHDADGWRPIRAAKGAGARERLRVASKRHGVALVQHTTGHRGIPLTEAIRTITTKDHWCIVDGQQYRPLTVRETARGMGFADSYGWPPGATRTDAMRGLGNAVCPPVARDLVGAVAWAAERGGRAHAC